MIDHLVGRPNPSWKRAQVFFVISFWLWRILRGNAGAPRLLWLRKLNRALQRFTPWQLIVSTLTGLYAVRNLDKILGLDSPEPLARLYSPSYYRATWITTGLDAGFATAMSIRPRWLRDICSVLFSVYYVIYTNEGDEKLRRFRAVPTVEMLRTTWEKTTNPYIRIVTRLPRIAIRRKILLPRPKSSTYRRPITAYIFFSLPEQQLCEATDLILDFPGGGFVAMSPEHHEERLRIWAIKTGRPVLSIDYGKAPEYPYPFAIDEAFDTYRVLVDSVGTLVGMSGRKLNIIISGDSAGATLAVNVMIKILEHNKVCHSSQSPTLPQPLALVLNYAALDFNFTSWMSPAHLRVLRSEQSSGNLPGLKELAAQKDHLKHVSPLSMVGDSKPGMSGRKHLERRTSWKDAFRGFTNGNEKDKVYSSPALRTRHSTSSMKTRSTRNAFAEDGERSLVSIPVDDKGMFADEESSGEEDFNQWKEEDRPIQARIRHVYYDSTRVPNHIDLDSSVRENQQQGLSAAVAEANATLVAYGNEMKGKGRGKEKEPIGTRLTMTSRTGYFQDRIISPSMMRAMAILYIGPHHNPDFATDYYISPILTPAHLLAQFPPLLMQCGEKDPFVDDTVIFAGRIKEAKRARKIELDLAISGKSARFGETLRMSNAEAPSDIGRLAAMMKERDKLSKENEDDWVQMALFSDWSHGYLQMTTLMSEAKSVIEELAEWIGDAFKRCSGCGIMQDNTSAEPGNKNKANPGGQLQPSDALHNRYSPSPMTSETEAEDPGITFVPKKHHRCSRVNSFDADQVIPISNPDAERAGRGSDAVTLGNQIPTSAPKSSLVSGIVNESRPEVRGLSSFVDGESETNSSQTPDAGTGKAVGHRQTITETEMMRRRRLLDAHIFE